MCANSFHHGHLVLVSQWNLFWKPDREQLSCVVPAKTVRIMVTLPLQKKMYRDQAFSSFQRNKHKDKKHLSSCVKAVVIGAAQLFRVAFRVEMNDSKHCLYLQTLPLTTLPCNRDCYTMIAHSVDRVTSWSRGKNMYPGAQKFLTKLNWSCK